MNILSIGGSDPSSGAGIQSDIKAISALNAYCLTTITAITGQNTTKFGSVEPVSKKILKNQMELIFSDFNINAIKIGMVYNSETIKILFNFLKQITIPIILDPVIKSTTGGNLIVNSAIKDFKKYLMPLATVITPNKFEAEFITKISINSKKDLQDAGNRILQMRSKNVVITGLELKNQIFDFVMNEDSSYFIKNKKLEITNHGSGCNYSAALAVFLAQGKSVIESAKHAQKFTFESIRAAKKIGNGITITHSKQNKMHLELTKAINRFIEMKDIFQQIPECQTNFVFSKKSPKSINDILGISGRIIKIGNSVTNAGFLEYGGSKHVGAAVLAINHKFPQVRSALNLKFQKETISKLEDKGFFVRSYDRAAEPTKVKIKEGSTIEWGITNAIKDIEQPPDIIYHEGDFGKEPMIIIFGTTPNSVIKKILKIFS